MLPKSFLPVVVATGVLFMLPATPSTWVPQVASAAFAKEFYTRKRVNGRWVTGKFAKDAKRGGVKRGGARHRLASRKRPVRAAAPKLIAAVVPPVVARPPVAVATSAPPAAAGTPAQGRGSADRAPLTTASLAPVPLEAGRERMRMALEARARTLAASASPRPAGSPPIETVAPAPAGPAPRTVTFDLETGSRTIVYGNDVVVSEPFDVGRVKDLVSAPAPAK